MRAPPAPSGDRDGVGAPFAWAAVALLAVLHAAPFGLTFVEGDFARDLDQAMRIVDGDGWPMRGPVLAWTLHLGPVWYWLVALPLAIARSIGASAAFVGILSALQFPLAYRVGTAFGGRAVGLAFAIVLALPGLTTLEGLWIAHPSLVPTAVLAVALASWHAWAKASPRWWVASMLLASLALHAHPTTLPVLALPAAAALRALRGRPWPALAAGVVAFLLPFAPLALDAQANAGELARFASGVGSDVARLTPARWLDAMAGVAWRVPDAIAGMVLSGRPAAPVGFRIALAIVYGFALAGLAVAGDRRRAVLVAVAAFAVTVAVAVAVRDTTRFYMLYAAWVAFAAAIALALAALRWRLIPIAVALGLSVAVSVAWTARAVDGEVRVPAALSAATDLSRGVPRGYTPLVTLTPFDFDRIGRHLCDASEVRAFGELAGVVDMLHNLPARLACGDKTRVVLGGADGPGTPMYLVHASAVPSGVRAERIGGFAIGRAAAAFAPAQPLPPAQGADYPWRRACGAPQPVTVHVTTRGPGMLVISNALPVTCPLDLVRVARDGVAQSPVERADSRTVALPAGESTWTIEATTGEPRALQVFAIRPGG
ncbi:MAG: hypothetical protein ACHQJ7_00300 [Vicinamibacteria bacterium]